MEMMQTAGASRDAAGRRDDGPRRAKSTVSILLRGRWLTAVYDGEAETVRLKLAKLFTPESFTVRPVT
jgi:hypothetical protein